NWSHWQQKRHTLRDHSMQQRMHLSLKTAMTFQYNISSAPWIQSELKSPRSANRSIKSALKHSTRRRNLSLLQTHQPDANWSKQLIYLNMPSFRKMSRNTAILTEVETTEAGKVALETIQLLKHSSINKRPLRLKANKQRNHSKIIITAWAANFFGAPLPHGEGDKEGGA
ncbi:hypothetical protein BX616_009401, partial [Lobosporangium transversale]